MEITPENKFKKLIVVGDRVLIKPKKDEEKTKSGLYLPPGVKEKEQVQDIRFIQSVPRFSLIPGRSSWNGKDLFY
jgi:chaperonin GroES